MKIISTVISIKKVNSIWIFALVLAIIKLWLTSHLPIIAIWAGHDHLKYVQMAFEISDFSPPFPYNQYTLMREPGYPFFIRLSYILGLSLRFSQELIYISSGFLLAWSFYKYYCNKIVVILFLTLYIFVPASFYLNRLTLRHAIYLPLTTFIISCLIHLINSKSEKIRFLRWSTILGIGLAWFWNTRPEGALIIPAIAIAYIIITIQILHSHYNLRYALNLVSHSIVRVLIPVFLVTLLLSTITYFKYGVFATNDLKNPGLKAVYSRLTTVSPDRWRYKVPVPRETRMEIYSVSPTFWKLSHYLEGEGKGWFTASCKTIDICDDYGGGWFVWALRDAVAKVGEYRSAPATEDFYYRIDHELKAACQSGQLKCKNRLFSLSSFAPDIHPEYVDSFVKSLGDV
ncbi:MAG: hypothetical protein F6K16_20625, partial [Symploca sp. SIO2B6]|nr:hypothetical protein [Symploca sp. SIO2B6]